MKRFILYSSIAIISFLGFLILFAPAGPIWSLVNERFTSKVPGLQINYVAGTVWQGQTEISYDDFPVSTLHWDLDPSALIEQKISANLTLQGASHHFITQLQARQQQISLTGLNGTLGSSYINAVSQIQGLTFNGDITVSNLNLTANPTWVESAEGHIDWPGGRIISRTEHSGIQVFNLPRLQGEITLQDKIIELNIHHNHAAVVDIQIKPSGWIAVIVRARFFDLAALPWPSASSLEDPVLEFEQKVF